MGVKQLIITCVVGSLSGTPSLDRGFLIGTADHLASAFTPRERSISQKSFDARFKTAAVGTPLVEFEPRGGRARAGAAP